MPAETQPAHYGFDLNIKGRSTFWQQPKNSFLQEHFSMWNLGTSAGVLGYVFGIAFLFLMAWTLFRQKRDIKDHSRL